jgi:hypothetical protein
LKIFRKGGTIQDGGFFTFYFQKFGKNQWIKIFHSVNWFLFINIHMFGKNQNGGQKPRWRQVDYFFNRNSTETPSSGFVIFFDAHTFS